MIFNAFGIHKKFPRSNFELYLESLELYDGAIVGVVGENGNGKTTLLNIVAGELEADGELNYFGTTVDKTTDWSQVKSQIAFIPQRIPRWFGSLIQNLKLKAALDGIEPATINSYLDEILEFLGLTDYKHLKWTEISTGYRLRFELARVLIGKPKLLVLDEPLANLDINTQQKFLTDLMNILKDRSYPTAVILSSQQLHELETVANQMIFLRSGKALFSGDVVGLEDSHEELVFEFQVEADCREAALLYLQTNDVRYKISGEYILVWVSKEDSGNAFLQALITEGIVLKYYRNISKSTKRLFNA